MKETVFNSQLYKIFVILLLSLLVLWNIYTFLVSDSTPSILRAVFQFLILMLIFTKSQYAKLGIKIFAALLIISSSITFIGGLIKIYFDQDLMSIILTLIVPLILLILGIVIYHYCVTTVTVKMVQKKTP
ncbi:hypothetical protein [Hanstruepera marina]|uniref:hypothetical protein n=1 Tax=Hanstruepera marina TaxID=2873265 RepID=UPI001CA72C0B|nr:hypothetical protein [Hanstruepera marina]